MTQNGRRPALRGPLPTRPLVRLDRRAAEQLLRRDPSAHPNAPRLAEVLDEAAAPGRPGELTGRHAAVAAFRRAGRPSLPGRSRSGTGRPVCSP